MPPPNNQQVTITANLKGQLIQQLTAVVQGLQGVRQQVQGVGQAAQNSNASIVVINANLNKTATTKFGNLAKQFKELKGGVDQITGSVNLLKTALTGLILGAGLKKFIGELTEAAERVNNISKTARRFGIDTEVFAGLELGARRTGVQINDLEIAFRVLGRNVGKASRDAAIEAQKAFNRIGFDFRAAADQGRSLVDIMGEIADRTQNLTAAQRDDIFTVLFGEIGPKLANFLADGSRGLREFTEEGRKLNATFSEEQGVKIEGLIERLRLLDAAYFGLRVTILTKLEPALTRLLDLLTQITASLPDLATNFVDKLGEAFGQFSPQSVQNLRNLGFSETDILKILNINQEKARKQFQDFIESLFRAIGTIVYRGGVAALGTFVLSVKAAYLLVKPRLVEIGNDLLHSLSGGLLGEKSQSVAREEMLASLNKNLESITTEIGQTLSRVYSRSGVKFQQGKEVFADVMENFRKDLAAELEKPIVTDQEALRRAGPDGLPDQLFLDINELKKRRNQIIAEIAQIPKDASAEEKKLLDALGSVPAEIAELWKDAGSKIREVVFGVQGDSQEALDSQGLSLIGTANRLFNFTKVVEAHKVEARADKLATEEQTDAIRKQAKTLLEILSNPELLETNIRILQQEGEVRDLEARLLSALGDERGAALQRQQIEALRERQEIERTLGESGVLLLEVIKQIQAAEEREIRLRNELSQVTEDLEIAEREFQIALKEREIQLALSQKRLPEVIDANRQSVLDLIDETIEARDQIEALLQDPELTDAQNLILTRALDQVKARLIDLQIEAERVNVSFEDSVVAGFDAVIVKFADAQEAGKQTGATIANALTQGIPQALIDIIDGTQSVAEAFKALAKNVIADLFRIITQALIARAVLSFIPGGSAVLATGSFLSANRGGGIRKLKSGGFAGPVPGPAINKDIVHALLTPREFVQPVEAVDHYGEPVMEAIRRRLIPRDLLRGYSGVVATHRRAAYATGGSVSTASIPSESAGSGAIIVDERDWDRILNQSGDAFQRFMEKRGLVGGGR